MEGGKEEGDLFFLLKTRIMGPSLFQSETKWLNLGT